MAPMTSQISKTSPPTRIFTSERRAAPAFPKSCGRGTSVRLPRTRQIHVDDGSDVRRIRHSRRRGASGRAISRPGVSCLLMGRDGNTAQREPAGQEALTRQPDPRPDGDDAVPTGTVPAGTGPDDPMSYTYTT